MLGCLALPRMLAAHAALAPLQGNPKAIALAVSLLQRGETGKTRPLAEVAALLGRDLGKGDKGDKGDKGEGAAHLLVLEVTSR